MLRSATLMTRSSSWSWSSSPSACAPRPFSRSSSLRGRGDGPGEMVGALAVTDREVRHVARDRAAERHGRRQQDRLAERDVDGEGVGQVGLRAPRRAGLGPHAVGDRAREAERLGGQRRACGSGCGRRRRRRSGGRGPPASRQVALRRAISGRGPSSPGAWPRPRACRPRSAAATQHRRLRRPDELPPTRASVCRVSVRPLGCGSSPVAHDPEVDAPRSTLTGRCWVIALARCTRPTGAERERRVGHQRHVQREGEHVRVGRAAGCRAA